MPPIVNCAVVPWQIALAPLMVGEGEGKAVMLKLDDDVHPFAFVTVTIYVPPVETGNDCSVEPVFHNHELPALAIKFAVVVLQKVAGPLIAELVVLITVANGALVATHPNASVTVTVNEPVVVTLIL